MVEKSRIRWRVERFIKEKGGSFEPPFVLLTLYAVCN